MEEDLWNIRTMTVIDGEVARMTKITKAEAEEKLQETTTRKTQSAVVNHDEELEDHRDEGELPLEITDLRLWSPDEINRMFKQGISVPELLKYFESLRLKRPVDYSDQAESQLASMDLPALQYLLLCQILSLKKDVHSLRGSDLNESLQVLLVQAMRNCLHLKFNLTTLRYTPLLILLQLLSEQLLKMDHSYIILDDAIRSTAELRDENKHFLEIYDPVSVLNPY